MYLVLGSCRVLVTMSYSKYNCLNTWSVVGNRGENPNKIIGRGWSLNEHYEMIKLILGIKCKEDYIGHEYNYNKIGENILYIRNSWNKIKGIIIEPSSIKYYTDENNKLIHNFIHSEINPLKHKQNILSEDENNFYLQKIIELLHNKSIIFVNHFLHSNIPNRKLINKCLNQIDKKNVIVVTPSNLWNNETKFDYIKNDETHYKDKKINDICKYIDTHIDAISN